MTKRTRLIILILCVACFFAIAPVLVFYSEGYRFDFEKMTITETGGIFVRTFPSADQITIDSNITEKPGFLANSVFVQSLLPKNHSVLVKKEGYYDYTKTLPVQEREVTKLENVLLFKKDLKFESLSDKDKLAFLAQNQQKFLIKNNNLYYSSSPENNSVSASEKKLALIKNVLTFEVSGDKIIWLGIDGFLYQENVSNITNPKNQQLPEKLNQASLKVAKTGIYKILVNGSYIFLNDNGKFLFLNNEKSFDQIFSNVKDIKISPDGKNFAYISDNKVYLYNIFQDQMRSFLELKKDVLLFQSNENLNNIIWINNDYLAFTLGNKIVFSEIDFRGNINTITLPEEVSTGKAIVKIISPQISFNGQEEKLYIQSEKNILVSERLIP